MRRALMMASALALSGCGGIASLSGGSATPSLAMFGGDMIAAGPPNYCVDRRVSRGRAGFAALAPCQMLGVEGPGVPAASIITVQAGAPDTATILGAETAFASVLKGGSGAALLSGSGDPATVSRLEAKAGKGVVTTVFEDSTPPPFPQVDSTVWRGFVDIKGRLVTVSLRSLTAAPISRAVGEALVIQTLSALVAANAAPQAPDA